MGAENLIPEVKAVKAGGEQIVVAPFAFGQLPAVSRHIGAVINSLRIVNGSVQLSELMADAGEDVIALAGIAAGKPRAWFDTLASDEGLELVSAVLEVNQDFFVQRMAPKLAVLVQLLTAPAKA